MCLPCKNQMRFRNALMLALVFVCSMACARAAEEPDVREYGHDAESGLATEERFPEPGLEWHYEVKNLGF